jgi:hypothetical protein
MTMSRHFLSLLAAGNSVVDETLAELSTAVTINAQLALATILPHYPNKFLHPLWSLKDLRMI